MHQPALFDRRRRTLTRAAELLDAGDVVHPEDVAGIIASSRTYVYEAIRAGILQHVRIGRHYRIPTRDAIRFVRDLGIEVAPATTPEGTTRATD